MESLQDILGRKDFTKPDEIEIIKNYIQKNYGSNSQVKLQRGTLIVSVASSSLAASLQLERYKMIKACKIEKKLAIRAG
jgi:outer membrane protein assembly factor BamA